MTWIPSANVHRCSTPITHGWEAPDVAPRNQKLWKWKFISLAKISLGLYQAPAVLHSNNKRRVMISFTGRAQVKSNFA